MTESILIVDDSTFIVEGLVALLKKSYRPIPSYSGEECLAILRKTTPSLIILDIMMEPMDGWETLSRIKEDPKSRHIPVLMFSAKKITPEEAREHSLNIEDFVSKPVNPSQLLDAINRVFERRKHVEMEAVVARDAGFDAALVAEYAALRKSIEVDRNLLDVLKKAAAIKRPGQEEADSDAAEIGRLEGKLQVDEQRLREINEKFAK